MNLSPSYYGVKMVCLFKFVQPSKGKLAFHANSVIIVCSKCYGSCWAQECRVFADWIFVKHPQLLVAW